MPRETTTPQRIRAARRKGDPKSPRTGTSRKENTLSIAQTPPPSDENTLTPIPSPKCTIDRDTRGRININVENCTIGNESSIIAQLPPSKVARAKQFRDTGYDLREIISHCLNGNRIIALDEWCRAIVSEYVARTTVHQPGAFVATTAATLGDCYLATDDTIFRLTPVAFPTPTKALASLRRRYATRFKTEGEKIVTEARSQAEIILRDASTRLLEAQQRQTQIERDGRHLAPTWATSAGCPTPLAWSVQRNCWMFGIHLTVTLTKFNFVETIRHPEGTDRRAVRTRTWNAVPHDPATFLLWVPIHVNGAYDYTNINLALNQFSNGFNTAVQYTLPHISYSASCMGLGDVPDRIISAVQLYQLQKSLLRVHAQVDCNSLLTFPLSWHPNHIKAIPPAISSALNRADRSAIVIAFQGLTAAADHTHIDENISNEHSDTFTVR